MDIVGWIFWLLKWTLSLAWSLAWLLLGGWVSTGAQILAILGIIAVYRYGWQRAPVEVWGQLSGFLRFLANWMRGRDAVMGRAAETRYSSGTEKVRIIRVKEPGDINMSTALSVLMLAGLWAVAAALD
jgi:hypothetical protein